MDQITVILYKRGNTCGQKWNSDTSQAKTVAIFGKISNFLGENANISVDLLIGANCVEAIQTLEVIPSQQDRPYEYRTILGWCVVGPIVDEKLDAVSCNQIAALQAENESIAKHDFQVQNKCEDTGITEMLRKIYVSDFEDTISEREDSIIGKMSEISNEYRRFLKILDAQTKDTTAFE